jgi:uncharacterized repeat protein (TIGR03803 family)
MRKYLAVIAVLAAGLGLSVGAFADDQETTLHPFQAGPNGYALEGKLIMDASGNLYGAALEGGLQQDCCGTIFKLSPKTGGGYTFTLLYTFPGGGNNYSPVGSLVMDSAGNLYGSAQGEFGEVFELSPNGSGAYTQTILATGMGAYPSPVVMDSAGNLYGTVQHNGANGDGFVFELTKASGYALTDIFDFDVTNGSQPMAAVILDSEGNLYGTTTEGGTSTNCSGGCGVVFELTNNAGTWTEQVLYDFDGTDGSNLQGGLLLSSNGVLYGTAAQGGANGYGNVFELTQSGGVWSETTLHNFTDAGGDGASPNTELIEVGKNLYGTTNLGGAGLQNCFGYDGEVVGCGAAYELSLSDGNWTETILHAFTGGDDGAFPQGLIANKGGTLFGVTLSGGPVYGGIAYKLTK